MLHLNRALPLTAKKLCFSLSQNPSYCRLFITVGFLNHFWIFFKQANLSFRLLFIRLFEFYIDYGFIDFSMKEKADYRASAPNKEMVLSFQNFIIIL